MTDGLGLLFSLPLHSIAVRTVVASLVAVLLARLLLQTGTLRVPRQRAAAAVLPLGALLLVLAASAQTPELPGLWLPVDAAGGLSVRVADTYVSFAPVAVEALLGVWAAVVSVRLALRGWRSRRTRRLANTALVSSLPTPPALLATVRRLAAAMGVSAPRVVLVPSVTGGAMVLGSSNPLLVLDAGLVAQLDGAELEGVVAHELAHVARRDNLVAALIGLARDVFFFVPGGSWSLGRLLREREHAADTLAVRCTGRPGALASGLLKVLEGAPASPACAPLLPEGTVVERVRILCDDRPAPSRVRQVAEALLTLTAVLAAVTAAAQLPRLLDDGGDRDALGILVSGPGAATTSIATAPAATAFRVYDGTVLEQNAGGAAPLVPERVAVDDPEAWDLDRLEACAAGAASCAQPVVVPSLPLQPPEVVRVDDERVARWRLDPVIVSEDREVGLFWFQQVE